MYSIYDLWIFSKSQLIETIIRLQQENSKLKRENKTSIE